jgi:hypothetical protein
MSRAKASASASSAVRTAASLGAHFRFLLAGAGAGAIRYGSIIRSKKRQNLPSFTRGPSGNRISAHQFFHGACGRLYAFFVVGG